MNLGKITKAETTQTRIDVVRNQGGKRKETKRKTSTGWTSTKGTQKWLWTRNGEQSLLMAITRMSQEAANVEGNTELLLCETLIVAILQTSSWGRMQETTWTIVMVEQDDVDADEVYVKMLAYDCVVTITVIGPNRQTESLYLYPFVVFPPKSALTQP